MFAWEDPVLAWQRLATAGMLHEGDFALFDRAISDLPTSDPVVEIGAWAGLSTNAILRLLERHERSNALISVDPWDFERGSEEAEAISGNGIGIDELRAHVRRQFEQNTRFWSGSRLPHAIEAYSDEFFTAWERGDESRDIFGRQVRLGGPISFAFLDGDHRPEQACRDFANLDRWLVVGGYVLLDDSDRFGAWRHLWEMGNAAVRSGRFQLVGESPDLLLRKTRAP